MKTFQNKGGIQRLFLFWNVLVFVALLFVEQVFLWNYRETIVDNMRTLTRAGADQIFSDINMMWYELNLISGTLSRSEAMRAYVRAEARDGQVFQALRSAVHLTQLAADNIDSIIVTDFLDIELFAYGAADRQVLKGAKWAINNGLIIKNPVHLQSVEGGNRLTYCINCTDSAADGSTLYTIIVYNMKQIRDAFSAVGGDYGINVLLLDGNSEPIMESLSLDDGQRTQILDQIRSGEPPDERLFMQSRSFSLLRWHLMAFVHESALTRRMAMVSRFAWVMNIFMLTILCAFLVMLRKHINEPIRQILDFMRAQALYSRPGHLELRNKNELNHIADGLNDMLDKQRLMTQENLLSKERIYRIELMQKQSEIAALTHQINPHFLYNTLDCMRGMASMGGMADLEEIISAMAYIFRYATRATPYVTVEEEMQSIARYMTIVRIRHGGRIKVTLHVEPSARELKIPKMLLQPIVENAVIHGLETVNRDGMLSIHVHREGDCLYMKVCDNGLGMDEAELDRLRGELDGAYDDGQERYDHIGLANIHRRIRLLYGVGCGLSVDSKVGAGTEVSIRILTEPRMK